MAIYGYARVSTTGQKRYGHSLEEQKQALRQEGATKIYEETYTGKSGSRPKLDLMLSKLKKGDMVVVTKLDRIARSVKDGIEIISKIMKKGCSIKILNMGLLDDSATGKLIVNILLSFAEFERDMIVQRSLEGKEIARLKEGYKEGRPRLEINFEKYKKEVESGRTVSSVCEELGISRQTWYNNI